MTPTPIAPKPCLTHGRSPNSRKNGGFRALRHLQSIAFLAAIHISCRHSTAEQTVVVPNANTAAAGNTISDFPVLTNADLRMQQVFGANQFPGPVRIIGVSFLYLTGNLNTFATKPVPDVFFSTTARTPDTLMASFAANRGPDHTQVFVHRQQSNFFAAFSARWGNQISFTTPFDYNPATGALLMETVGPGGNVNGVTLDAVDTPGDSISRVFAYNSAATEASTLDTAGTIVRFHYVPFGSTYVDIHATDSAASETGPDPAVFRVTRTGSTGATLTVSYLLEAPANTVTPADLLPLSGSVIIPAGSTTADIIVTPINDGLAEPAETIRLAIQDSAGYTSGTAPWATATLAASTAAAVTVRIATASLTGNTVNLTFTGLEAGINYTVQRSFDLSTWTAAAQRTSATPTFSEALPTGQKKVFYRLAK